MTSREANPELSLRWSEWLRCHNQRGMRVLLWIVLCSYPALGLFEFVAAPARAQPASRAVCALVALVTLLSLVTVSRPGFRRHAHAASASYVVLLSLGTSLMTASTGGLASPFYAGVSLVMVASGLLFVWPRRVMVPTYIAIALGCSVLALWLGAAPDLWTALTNQFFLISTGLIAALGQLFAYRSQRQQVSAELARDEAARSLERANEQLERLHRFKSEFFANLTHELETPLTLILAPLGSLLEGQHGALSEAQRLALSAMQRSGFKLSRLIGDLLDLSQLDESRLRLRIEEHDLVAYLDGLVRQIEPLAQRKRLRLAFRADAPRADVWCDIHRLERVFLNLLSNAAKFTDVGGWIEVRLSHEERGVRVDVIDDGPGFPSEMREEVFERFVRADQGGVRRVGGAGIGLALAKALVELHGGQIEARSAPGEGATFTVRLRKDREHYRADVLELPERGAARAAGRSRGRDLLAGWEIDTPEHLRLLDIDEATDPRPGEQDHDEHRRAHSVLVVEDTPDVARLLRTALQRDYQVLIAGDGQQGLALARRHRPSIIVTDWMMPELDGLALTRELRRDPSTRHIPIVMLTARRDLDDRVRGLETGVSAFVAKPFSASEIVSTVRSLQRSQDATADSLLSQKMESLEAIAGGLAHEILNPLNYLKNALTIAQNDSESLARVVKSGASGPPESGIVRRLDRMQEMFELSRDGVSRIAGTVDRMVRYSRDGRGRSPTAYDAFAGARDVAAVVGPSVARDVAIELDLEGHGWIDCVPEEFNQVLSNLLENALEAAPKGGAGRVVITGRNDGPDLLLSVMDNGPGIPESQRARIFDAFYTTKQTGHGIGLGLTIARRVVVSLGGTLKLESEVGKGSVFSVRVPSSLACREAAS